MHELSPRLLPLCISSFSLCQAQFKKNPRGKKNRTRASASTDAIDSGDIALEEVADGVAAVSVSAPADAAVAPTAAIAIPASFAAASAEEAVAASQSQVNSPQPVDHHVPAHKHEIDHQHHPHAHHQHHHHQPIEEDEAADADVEGSESGASDASSEISATDKFPYEKNLFSLCPSYHFIKRLYTCEDAVTYKAFSKLTNGIVAIKVCDGYDGKVAPKEVRLLNSAQGHKNICVMNGWYGALTQRIGLGGALHLHVST